METWGLTDRASEQSVAQHPTVGNGSPPESSQRGCSPNSNVRDGITLTVFVVSLPMYRHERWAEGGRRARGARRNARDARRDSGAKRGPARPMRRRRALVY